jgi:hypothetical protein
MGEIQNSNPESQKPKESDEMRRKIEEDFPQLEKPFEKWSDLEKFNFANGLFNNFFYNCPGGSQEKRILSGKQDNPDIPIQEAEGKNDERVAEEIKSGRHSERFYKETYRQFFSNIRYAFEKNGINVEEFSRRNELKAELARKIDMWGHQRKDKNEEYKKMVEEHTDLWAKNTLESMSVFLDLIDSGYAPYDLGG